MEGSPPNAANQVLASIIAFLIIGASITVVLSTTTLLKQDLYEENQDQLQQDSTNQLLQKLLTQPKYNNNDLVTFALLKNGTTNIIDPTILNKIENNQITYQEAKQLLGLTTNQDFHLTIDQLPIPNILTKDLSNTRIAYIAAWGPLLSVTVPLNIDDQVMIDNTHAQLDLQALLQTNNERQALATLNANFTNQVHITTSYPDALVDLTPLPAVPLLTQLGLTLIEGDVYPDDSEYIKNVLPARLNKYDVLIIGTEANHNNLLPNEIKDPLRAWVEAGGSVVSLGSTQSNYNWLPTGTNAQSQNNINQPEAYDVKHNALNKPYKLNWETYNTPTKIADVAPSNGYTFENILHTGEDNEDTAYGVIQKNNQYIAITGFDTTSLDSTEIRNMLTNLITYRYLQLTTIEYGATIPTDRTVTAQQATLLIENSYYNEQPIRLTLYYWT